MNALILRLAWDGPTLYGAAGGGVAVGILSLAGFGVVWEAVFWALGGAQCVGLVAWRRPPGRFRHGFLAGLVLGAAAVLVEVTFLGRFLDTHPDIEQNLRGQALPGPVVLLVAGLVASVGLAVVIGALTVVATPRAPDVNED